MKGGVVVYGDAELPRPERSAATAEDASRAPIPEPQTVDPFARALLAAVDPNARKEARKSLDRRQAVATTSTASSGTPGGKTAGGLTKEKSFGRANSSGPLLPMDNRGPFDIATLAIFPEYVEFDAQELLRFVVPGAAGRTIK